MAEAYVPGDGREASPSSVFPVKSEDLRFSFVPSDQLAEHLWALTKPSYRNEMGRRGLMLYSDPKVQVVRRSDGTLDPIDARMANELRRIVDSKPSNTHRRLSRAIGGGLVRNPATNAATGVRVDFGVLLDPATKVQLGKSELIPREKLFTPEGVNAHIVLPIRHIVDRPEFDDRYAELQRFVRGADWDASRHESDRRSPSLTIGAYVTHMQVGHR